MGAISLRGFSASVSCEWDGALLKDPCVRLDFLPVEGCVLENDSRFDIDEKTRVCLIRTDAERGFDDFSRIGQCEYALSQNREQILRFLPNLTKSLQ